MAFFVSGITGLFLHAIFTLVKCLFYAGFLVGILLTLFPWLVGSMLPGRRPKKPWRRTRVKSTRISVRSLSYPIRARLGANVFREASSLKWFLLPLRSVPSSQSLAPTLWLSPHWSCHVLSALLRAGFSVSAGGKSQSWIAYRLCNIPSTSTPSSVRCSAAIGVSRFEFFFFDFRARENGEGMARHSPVQVQFIR